MDNPFFSEDYLAHYGIKGMKWGKRKKTYELYKAAERQAKRELDEATSAVKNYSDMNRQYTSNAQDARNQQEYNKNHKNAFRTNKDYQRAQSEQLTRQQANENLARETSHLSKVANAKAETASAKYKQASSRVRQANKKLSMKSATSNPTLLSKAKNRISNMFGKRNKKSAIKSAKTKMSSKKLKLR